MRVFLSIDISNNEIINSIRNFQNLIKVDAKPIQSEKLHFTLQFLGEISENKIELVCLLYTSPSPRDKRGSRMPSSA